MAATQLVMLLLFGCTTVHYYALYGSTGMNIFSSTYDTGKALAQDSAFAIPMLFPYKSCNTTPGLETLRYEIFFAHFEKTVETPLNAYTTSGPRSYQIAYGYKINQTFHWEFFYDERVATPFYQCQNSVFGLYVIFYSNPTLSLIVLLQSPSFTQVLSILPLPSYLELHSEETVDYSYEYFVLFGSHFDTEIMDGVAISVVTSYTNITVQSGSDLVVLRNAKTVIDLDGNSDWVFDNLLLWEVLWIEPKVNACSNKTIPSLKGTKILSTHPLSVFTTKVKCNQSGAFSYDSQIVHQIPAVDNWGKTFITDVQQATIIPETYISELRHELHILSVESETNITITYYNDTAAAAVNKRVFTMSKEQLTITLETEISASLTHLQIHSSNSILVVYELHSITGSISYSSILQPVEWFSNQQLIILWHPRNFTRYRYHIGVVVPQSHYNPKDIVIKDTNTDKILTLSEYRGFSGKVFSSGDYVIFYLQNPDYNKSLESTELLLSHRNTCGILGVTVYAYNSDLHYVYNNGFVMDTYNDHRGNTTICNNTSLDHFPPTPDEEKERKNDNKEIAIVVVIASLTLLVAFTFCFLKGYWTFKKQLHNSTEREPPYTDYEFDIFLSFAEADKEFTEINIHVPLMNKLYRVFWHYEHFKPGLTIMENIIRAVKLSRRTIFICSRHFMKSEFCKKEMDYCLRVQEKENTRRVIPVVLEECCPEEFKHFNQIRLSGKEMDDNEIQQFLLRLKLGDPINMHKRETVQMHVRESENSRN